MYKLSAEKQSVIGNGYDVYIKSMEWVSDNVRTLKALLSYRSNSMINSNKSLAFASIETSIDALNELREAINNMGK